MSAVLVFFAVGVLLLAFEVVVPGAVLGIIGGLFMLGGVVVAGSRFGLQGGILAGGAALAIAAVVLYLEFVLLPKSRLAKKFSMSGTVAGTSRPPVADRAAVVGRRALAVTPLAPGGYVELDGRRYEASARDGLAQTGEWLHIVDVDDFRLIVSKPPTSTH